MHNIYINYIYKVCPCQHGKLGTSRWPSLWLRLYHHCTKKERMMDKPAGLGQRYASAFQEDSVADAYAYRPPYPPAVFDVLATLLPTQPRCLLDVGCGTGAIARHLTSLGVPLDAVDISPAMIARGRRLPGGDHALIHWLVG